jgi:DNA-binding LytR/AlgR family response regulator
MSFKYRILVVDDEPSIREISEILLVKKGFEVRTAGDGFEALVELRRALPDVIISDLTMPNMSGFELLSIVRRRFPQIPIIVISAAFTGLAPGGVIADAFFYKGDYALDQLFTKIAELLERSPLRPHLGRPERAPLWIPLNTEGYFVVTCTQCLRSSPVEDKHDSQELRETTCIYCDSKLQFLAHSVAKPQGSSKHA